MNEEALNDAYTLFISEGYNGTLDEFKVLINQNQNALNDSYKLFQREGYNDSFEDFQNLLGVKKKDSQEPDGDSELEAGLLDSKDAQIDTLTATPQPFLRNRQPGYYPQGEKDTAIERMFGKNEITDFFGDLYRSGVQGYRQGATVDDALNLFAQGQNISDQDLAEYIQEYRNLKAVAPSDEMQEFSEIYEREGKGVLGFIKGVAKNPTVIPQLFTSSVVAMVNKGSIAAGLTGAGAGAAVGALPGALIGGVAGVSGALETGLAYSEFLEEELNKKGLAFDNKGIRQVLEDEEAMVRIRNRALGRGISIAAIDAVTGGLAAGITRRAALKTGKALAAARGVGVESIGGATGEAVARAIAGQEMDIAEIGFEGVAGTATAPITVGAGLLKPGTYELNGGKATRKQVQDLVNKGTPDEIAGAQITIKNDPELFKAAETKKADAILIAQIKEANPGISEEDQAALLGLEKKRQGLESSSLKSAKNNLAIVDEQIDKISKKYQGTEETIVTTEEEARESLAAKGIENPTQQQLIEESDLITNKKLQDANQVESPVAVPDEEQPTAGQAVVEGDNQPTELAGETAQAQEETTDQQGQEGQVETEVSETETVEETTKERLQDSQVIKSVEIFEVVDNDGDIMTVEVRTKLDGSRTIRLKDGDGVLVSEVKLSKDNTLSNKEHIEKSYGEIKSSESKPGASIMTQKKIDRLSPRQKKALGLSDDVNTKIDTTKLPLFQYKKKKYRKVESLKKPEGVSLYIEEGKPLFIDKYGTYRPSATEKYQMSGGIYMGDSMLRPIKDQAQESKTTITESEDITSIPIDDKFVARIKDNKVVEIADNDGNVVDEATARKLEKKIIDKQIIPLAQTDFISQERIEQQALEDTIESSKSPRQIANVIQQLQRVDKTETQIKKREVKDSYSGLGAMFALGVKFTPESVKEQTGFANLKKEFGFPFMQSWIRKDGVSIKDGFIDENGKKYTADQVLNFITEYKTQKQYVDKADDTSGPLLDAKEKFTELTGLKATATNIKKVAESPSIEELQDQAFLEEKRLESQPKQEESTPKKEEEVETKFSKEFLEEIETENKNLLNDIVPKFNTIDSKSVQLGLFNLYSKVKASIAPSKENRRFKSSILEDVRSTPTPYIDISFGLKNSRVLYNSFFRRLVEGYSALYNNLQEHIEKSDRIYETLRKDTKDANQQKTLAYEIGVYLAQLEHESGNSKEVSPPAVDLINATLRSIDNGDILTKADGVALRNILSKYEKDGSINASEMFESFTDTQKKATRSVQKLNSSLYERAKKAAERRGIPFEEIENYSHRQVLKDNKQTNEDVAKQAENYANPSTLGQVLIQRTPGPKAMQFNPFSATKRGAQEVFLDFYVTPVAQGVQDLSQKLIKKYSQGNKTQREAAKAMQMAIQESLKNTYFRSFQASNNTIKSRVLRFIERNSYRLLLSSIPRFAAEVMGNAAMMVSQDAKVIEEAYGKYSDVWSKIGAEENTKFIDLLKNVNSAEVVKLAGERSKSYIDTGGQTKYVDRNNILNVRDADQGLLDPIRLNVDYLSRTGAGKGLNFLTRVSDFLMGGADRIVARPIWVSKFANSLKDFVKQYNNEDIDITVKDFDEMSSGQSKYLSEKYKKAIRDAVRQADQTTVSIATSGNPMNTILKNSNRMERGGMNLYRKLNSFMANFTLNEYANARAAIGALRQSGEMSQGQAARTLGALLARMSSYVILYRLFSDYMDQLFGAPPDEDEDLTELLTRQAVGSAATLMFRQNLGNIPSLPINLGLEYINKNYLSSLRDGAPYNSYENSIVFSLIDLDQLGKEPLLMSVSRPLLGPYGPLYNTLERTVELVGRTQTRKTQDARDRAMDELINRMSFESLGQLGFIPFYKDARRIMLKKRFRNKETKSISKTQLKKLNRKLYDRLYGPDSPTGKRKKRERELRKRSK